MLVSDYGLLQAVGAIVIFLTYTIFQFAMFYDRDLVDKNGKIYNKDGIDVTNKVPNYIYLQFVIFVFLIWPLNSLVLKFNLHLQNILPAHSELISSLKDVVVIYMPYLVIHIYFFIKNLPVVTLLRFMRGSASAAVTKARDFRIETRSYENDRYYNSSHSSYGSNIFHSSRKD